PSRRCAPPSARATLRPRTMSAVANVVRLRNGSCSCSSRNCCSSSSLRRGWTGKSSDMGPCSSRDDGCFGDALARAQKFLDRSDVHDPFPEALVCPQLAAAGKIGDAATRNAAREPQAREAQRIPVPLRLPHGASHHATPPGIVGNVGILGILKSREAKCQAKKSRGAELA